MQRLILAVIWLYLTCVFIRVIQLLLFFDLLHGYQGSQSREQQTNPEEGKMVETWLPAEKAEIDPNFFHLIHMRGHDVQ